MHLNLGPGLERSPSLCTDSRDELMNHLTAEGITPKVCPSCGP
jgi:hypothetical protein